MSQTIRFCRTADGTRLAYAAHGSGPPLVKASNWLTHLEFDWESPVWRHWMSGLAQGRTLIRYDERGGGLSDRDPRELHMEAWVRDLETVVDAAGLDEPFDLLGVSQGAATAVEFAVRHPDRVRRLVLYGGYAQGRKRRSREAAEQSKALVAAIRAGWGQPMPAFRRLFTMLYVPGGTPEQMEWLDELMRVSVSPEVAARIREARDDVDVTDRAARVAAPTLVMHARDDALVPYEQGRLLATLIPTARLVPLHSSNHILLEDEPAWPAFLSELADFLGTGEAVPVMAAEDLSGREREVLELVAAGLSNDEIAERLVLSVRTVERHLSNIYVKLGVSGKAARAAAAAHFSRT